MHIRNATMDDLEQIAFVESRCFPMAEAATEKDFEARLKAYPNHFWLLFEGIDLISFINGMVTNERDLSDEMYENAEMHDENGDWQMIFGINTMPGFRGQGNASKLIRKMIAVAKMEGRKGLVLTCKQRLIPYYATFGFVNEGVSKSVHGNVTWFQMRLEF